MDNREMLIENVKNWIKIDNEIKLLSKEIKDRRQQKKELTHSLVDIMKNNEIDCFDIKDGQLIYTKNKIKKPLSKKHLLTCLKTYFNGDAEQVNGLCKYIMNTREEQIKENIKRKKI